MRQIAMGHAGTGLPLDIATISMNPAGLTLFDRSEILAGSNFTFISTAYQAPAPSTYSSSTVRNVKTPFSVYASYKPPVESLVLGLGVYMPYGNTVEWEQGWKYQFQLQRIVLQSFYVQPTVAYRVHDKLSLGAGFILALGNVTLQRTVPLADADGNYRSAELEGRTYAFGFNAGIFGQLTPAFSYGISYRSEIQMSVEGGDARFEVPASVQSLFPEGNTFDSSLPLPAVLTIAFGYRATERLRFAADANRTFWGTYESLEFRFATHTDAVQDISDPRRYNDVWSYRLGAEFDVHEKLQLRAGVLYDMTPVDEGYMTPETPDVDRLGFTAGFGWNIASDILLNTSIVVIATDQRYQSPEVVAAEGMTGRVPEGTFQTIAIIPGFSLSYKF